MNARRGTRVARAAASPRRQRGLAVVELALVTPAILVMMMVAAEFTRVFYQFNTLTKSVRDAARIAADSADRDNSGFELDAAAVTAARSIAATGSVNGGEPLLPGLGTDNFTVQRYTIGSGGAAQEHVRVVGTYTFQPFAPVLSGMGFLTGDVSLAFTLTATSTMRAL